MVKTEEKKRLNKFEKTRLLSARAYELSKGATPKVKVAKKDILLSNDYVKIAQEEMESGKLELDIHKKINKL